MCHLEELTQPSRLPLCWRDHQAHLARSPRLGGPQGRGRGRVGTARAHHVAGPQDDADVHPTVMSARFQTDGSAVWSRAHACWHVNLCRP